MVTTTANRCPRRSGSPLGPAAIAGLDDPWDQMVAAVSWDFPDGPHDTDAIISYLFSGEPRFAQTYGALSAALHVSQVGLYRSIVDTGIALGVFSPDLDSQTVARALVALTDSYGLQVVIDEPGVDRASAVEEVLRIAASLLRITPRLATQTGLPAATP